MAQDITQATLDYHSRKPAGKLQIQATKPLTNQQELSLAYTPGVAIPCLEIAKNKDDIYKYTNRGNSVAVVSDGTAVLGLGNIGAEAGLPVMEGKSVLFKKFADIDAYPLCVSFGHLTEEKARFEAFYNMVRSLEPSLAGVNLEDIAAPLCFELEERLNAEMQIPVFHDDQHGTAIIITAGLKNALKVTGKKIEEIKIVFNGAGSAGIACARLLVKGGVKRENVFMCDSKGLIVEGREGLNEYKKMFAQSGTSAASGASAVSNSIPSLADALKGADVFIGVSVAGALKPEMIAGMAKGPMVFALANPVPEIMPDEAVAAGVRIIATGRSDFPNQLNNVLGYPGIFRGALDVRAMKINDEMKIAAAEAIASLASEMPTGEVKAFLEKAYPAEAATGVFGRGADALSEKYIVPKLFDLRVVPRVARCVAEAAMKSGVARVQIADLAAYEAEVLGRVVERWV